VLQRNAMGMGVGGRDTGKLHARARRFRNNPRPDPQDKTRNFLVMDLTAPSRA